MLGWVMHKHGRHQDAQKQEGGTTGGSFLAPVPLLLPALIFHQYRKWYRRLFSDIFEMFLGGSDTRYCLWKKRLSFQAFHKILVRKPS